MLLKAIILISIIQVSIYLVLDKLKVKYGKSLLLLVILGGYFFVLPSYFYPEPQPDGINCGMPIMAINFACWVLGGVFASFTHVVYSSIKIVNEYDPVQE